MKNLTSTICLDREFRQAMITLTHQLSEKKPLPIVVNGLSGGAVDAFAAEAVRTVRQESGRPSLLFASDEREANRMRSVLAENGLTTAFYPSREFCFYNMSASHDVERERLFVLFRLLVGELDAVVTTPFAAFQPTVPADALMRSVLSIKPGGQIAPEALVAHLEALGYVRVDTVDGAGQYARRGGILDLFAGGAELPLRLDFFGDEIDRLCWFDPLTQRVVSDCPAFTLLPAKEVLADGEAVARVRAAAAGLLKHADNDAARQELLGELAAIDGKTELHFLDKYIALVYGKPGSLADVFRGSGESHPVFVLGTNEIHERLHAQNTLLAETVSALLEGGILAGKYALYGGEDGQLDGFLREVVAVHLNPFAGGVGSLTCAGLFGFRCRRTVSFADRFDLLCEELGGYLETKYRVLLITGSEPEADACYTRLTEKGFLAQRLPENTEINAEVLKPGSVLVGSGHISSGYELMNARVVLLCTDRSEEQSGAHKRLRRQRNKVAAGKRILSYADLSEGDYVVHAAHGIGVFDGIRSMTVDGVTRDYITIRYAGTDQLFLPAERLEMISKYIGARSEDGTVKLSKLGGAEWQKAKSRAKSAARDMAKELIALYALRQRRPGFSFDEDGEMDRQFADAFEFEETDSQIAAIREIKADMMKPVPMDRLLCGDVGFGKTEVALRAAFKAILGGKQVAFLVPTTILALQHYQTALSRMRGFPVTVEMLSRFRTAKEQAAILRRLHRGEIDLIIGTHKLLGGKVEFRDLGLLIVDEEQRFGVAQKEKLKKLAADMDVLTLTATPIPRTLNMAMSGIRDMSILDEAPGDRFPVQTFVLEHDDFVIAEAMRRELARGGQVLYLYNKVENIDLVAGRVMKALPGARVAFAHGKMEHDELEDIWQALVRGELDVLVCTTIIETGVDLPNANTLIIENADRMGLAQLHQIRGRVGRSGRHAYAYFTYRKGKALTEIATKRLSAIREYAEFGAGFKIALRDLEIRGAGNLLGAEQHGHIDAVGYDLYIRLLNEAVLEEQGKRMEAPFESVVDFRESANIPAAYIALSAQRMEMYKKISLILTEEDRGDVLGEFRDRFGEPPAETVRLLDLSLLRALASRAHITRVECTNTGTEKNTDRLQVSRPEVRFLGTGADLSVWAMVFGEIGGLRFGGTNAPGVTLRLKRGEDAARAAVKVLLCFEEKKKEFGKSKEEPETGKDTVS